VKSIGLAGTIAQGEVLVIDQRFGSYRVVRKLGEGGMGCVYEAVHDEIGKRVAIKVLHATYSREPEIRARFLSEARAVNLVQHPGLVSIFDYGCTADDAAYLIMEFLQGETLRARLQRQRKLPVEDTQRVLRQLVDAMGAAHEKGIVHRELRAPKSPTGKMRKWLSGNEPGTLAHGESCARRGKNVQRYSESVD